MIMTDGSSASVEGVTIKHKKITTGDHGIGYSERSPEHYVGRPILFMGGIPPLADQDTEKFLNQLADAGCGHRVFAIKRPNGHDSCGEKYIEAMRTLVRHLLDEEAQKGLHIIGHSLGGAEAIQLVHSMIKRAQDVEKVRQLIASLIVINSAGLTKNSRLGHMIRFWKTSLATSKLPDKERAIQTPWIQSCNDPSKILQRWKEVGHIVALSRGQIVKMLLEIKNAGIQAIAVQAQDDTLIKPGLLHKEIKELVMLLEDAGNHLGIYAQFPHEIITLLDAIDSEETRESLKNQLYTEVTG